MNTLDRHLLLRLSCHLVSNGIPQNLIQEFIELHLYFQANSFGILFLHNSNSPYIILKLSIYVG